MDFLNDKKYAPLVIAVLVLALGGAVFSCVHFMGVQIALPSAPPKPPTTRDPGKPRFAPGSTPGQYVKLSGPGSEAPAPP